jgi:hypothetical protein
LFSKDRSSNGWVKHLLCQGFQKDISARSVHRGENATSAIPGVLSVHPNSHVIRIKAEPWPHVLALMGKEGERAMIDLLLDCGIFLVVGSGCGTFHQLSGKSDRLKESHSLTRQAILWAIFSHCQQNLSLISSLSLLLGQKEVRRILSSFEIE